MKRKISGLHCQKCVEKIQNELNEEFGPISISDDLSQIEFNGDAMEFGDALADLGFRLHAAD